MRRIVAIAAVAGLVVAVGAGWWMQRSAGDASSAADSGPGARSGSGSSRGGAGRDAGPIPVTLGRVVRRDMPVLLEGLGSVIAFNTVTVRPQVGGQLLRLAFDEGQTVEAGALLAEIDPRSFRAQLQQAEAQVAQNRALLATARRDLQRFEQLVGDGYVSRQQLDTQAQTVAQLEATVAANEAAAQSARVSLGFTRITAPIAGVTGLRRVDVGNIVEPANADGLVVITQVQPIAVLFTLPEQTLAEIRAAGGPGLAVTAFDRDNAAPLARGELTVIDNQIDATTGTVRLKATFPNADRALWPGQFVNMRLNLRTVRDGLVIPANAVQQGPEGPFVYVAGRDEAGATVALKREVVVGRNHAGDSLIERGLEADETIVVDGQYRLRPGARIRDVGAATPADASPGPDSDSDGEHRRPASAPAATGRAP